MIINIISFTEKGVALSLKIAECVDFSKMEEASLIRLFSKYEAFNKEDHLNITFVNESLKEWTYSKQNENEAIVFIGAAGIAVRAIADGIKDKLLDSPVIVIDEKGQFIIPILSGHLGGANELAINIAHAIDGIPVITTATDIEGCFSVDLFAKENNLLIENREGIARVSSKALLNKPVRISIENYPPEDADVVISSDKEARKLGTIGLCPKIYGIGIGVRKGIEPNKLEEFIKEELEKINISLDQVGAMASVNLKEDEEAILSFSSKYRIPFITFTPEILNEAKGEFSESVFVKEKVGTGNVCERAAMLLTNNQGTIVLKKTARDGMTIAVSKKC